MKLVTKLPEMLMELRSYHYVFVLRDFHLQLYQMMKVGSVLQNYFYNILEKQAG